MKRFFNAFMPLTVYALLCHATAGAITPESLPPETGMNENIADSVRSVSLFFKANESTLDRGFLTNEQNLRDLKEMIGTGSSEEIVSIDIVTHSSPEGSAAFNRALTQKRADTIYRLLLGVNPELGRTNIVRNTVENDWLSIKSKIEADDTLSSIPEVLRIIGNPNHSEMTKEMNLRRMSNGTIFRELDRKILRYMRVGIITVTTRHSVQEIPIVEVYQDPVTEVSTPEEPFVEILPQPAVSEYMITYPVALKTNLLFFMVGGINIGVEVPIGSRFSASADFTYAYWRINNRFALQTLQGGIEAKYWFNRGSRPLTGWNLGVYGLYSSRYDIQWQGGWQGDKFISSGLTAGYSLPISRSLNLEFAAAAGAFYTPEARKYSRPQNGHLMWEETRQNVWRVFPTKLKVNLVWLIQSKKRVVEQ